MSMTTPPRPPPFPCSCLSPYLLCDLFPSLLCVVGVCVCLCVQDKNLIKAAVDRLNEPDLDEEEKF